MLWQCWISASELGIVALLCCVGAKRPGPVQLFVLNWSAPDVTGYRQAVTRFVADLASSDRRLEPEGVAVVARAHFPQTRGGITFCEARDFSAVQAFVGPWMARYGFSYTIDPALCDQDMATYLDSVKHLR